MAGMTGWPSTSRTKCWCLSTIFSQRGYRCNRSFNVSKRQQRAKALDKQLINAQTMADLMGGQSLAGQNAGAQQLANAQQQADLMSQAAAAGQGAGDADFAAARGFTGPQGYESFMSPYQQEVIDSTMADYQQELARQQSQLGLGAGNAFGGSRFGVAQGELGAQGATRYGFTISWIYDNQGLHKLIN